MSNLLVFEEIWLTSSSMKEHWSIKVLSLQNKKYSTGEPHQMTAAQQFDAVSYLPKVIELKKED